METRWKVSFIIAIAIAVCLQLAAGELRRLITLSRHGSRAPNYVTHTICPNNHANLQAYKVPPAQLTVNGMNQLVQVGKHIREIYVETQNFLSESFSGEKRLHFEAYFRADAATRCAHSAEALALGLYPFGSGPEGFPLQLVPVTMELLQHEHVFAAPKGPCKATLARDLAQYAQQKAPELFQGEDKDVLDRLGAACGINMTDVPHLKGGEDLILAVKDIADMLTFDQQEGLSPLPGLDTDTMKKVEQLGFRNLMERYYSSDRMITYWNGAFPDLLLKNLNDAARPNSPTSREYRYFSYHGHRELLHALGKLLGWEFHFNGLPEAMNTTSLEPGTTLFFELHANKSDTNQEESYFVRTFLYSPATARQQIKLSKCSQLDCPLLKFNRIIRNHIDRTGTWEAICGYDEASQRFITSKSHLLDSKKPLPATGRSHVILYAVAGCILAIFAAFIVVQRVRRRGYRHLHRAA
uniref:Uncharacterized protein AlNc14C156G7650 n=1 Tax=Albugo laibachii Nc14 TaxID=890382 RepID=F0WMG0_9STRA|nr:conserved hypothetical protein [Albugo laibachii Nc14]|eukprot:CCA22492.1 conserved hypothetical protein [Albugo laibachii Nc14]